MKPTPILIIGFNRPDTLFHVLDQALAVNRPVFISIDAPRPGNEADQRAVNTITTHIRSLGPYIDGHIILRTAEHNQGCLNGVPNAITWAFEHTDRLIILEDDCLPTQSFFTFADDLLERYADDQRIGMIAGTNHFPAHLRARNTASYHFSRYPQIWGWATWKRAWQLYDQNLTHLPTNWRTNDAATPDFGSPAENRHWYRTLEHQRNNPRDTVWDSRWLFSMARNHLLSVVPSVNLVRNIGFGSGTHCQHPSALLIKPREHLPQPLIHPTCISPWRQADLWWFRHIISKHPWYRLQRYLNRIDPATIQDSDA